MNRQSANTTYMTQQLNPVPRGSRTVCCLLLVLSSLTTAGGCKNTDKEPIPVMDQISKATSDLLRKEPTGTIGRNISLDEAAQAVKERVNQLDVEGANEAVAEIKALTAELRSRTASLPENLGQMLTDWLDEARLPELSARLQELIDDASAKVAQIDLLEINKAVTEVRGLVTQLSEKLEAIDIDEGNSLVGHLSSLKPSVDEAIEQVTHAVARMDAATADLQRLFPFLQITLCVAILLLLLLTCCAIVWLRRCVRL